MFKSLFHYVAVLTRQKLTDCLIATLLLGVSGTLWAQSDSLISVSETSPSNPSVTETVSDSEDVEVYKEAEGGDAISQEGGRGELQKEENVEGASSDGSNSSAAQETGVTGKSTAQSESERTDEAGASPSEKDQPNTKIVENKPKRPKFNIWEYRIEGNSILSAVEIEKVVYPHLGTLKTIEDVEKARVALEKYYKERGYPTVIVNIPQQKVKNGVIRLAVVEGVVSRFRVSGSRYHTISGIKESLPSLAPGQVFDISVAREEINTLNRVSQDLSTTPILKPGKKTGTLEVDLQVTDKKPIHGSLEVNNRYTANTTELRSIANLSYANLWQKFHSLSLQYQTAPEDRQEVDVVVGTYLMPINKRKDRLAMYAVQSDSNVPAPGVDSVLGSGQIFGVRYVSLLPSASGYFQNATFGYDYKDFDDAIVGVPDPNALIGEDTQTRDETAIDYMQLSAEYSGTFVNQYSQTKMNLGAVFGVGPYNDAQEFEDKRLIIARFECLYDDDPPVSPSPECTVRDAETEQVLAEGQRKNINRTAKPDYFYITAGLEQIFSFRSWDLIGDIQAQHTNDLLISNEQFSIGGADSARGYLESQHAGDRGITSSIELWTPNWFGKFRWSDRWLKSRAFLFYDYAQSSVVITAPEEIDKFHLRSHGAGIEFYIAKNLYGLGTWAKSMESSGTVLEDEERFHFDVRFEF